MLPKVQIEIGTEAEKVVQPSLTWGIDFEKKRVTGRIDGLEAIKQSIYMTLLTERYRYLIYSWNYGVELEDLIGKDYDYVQSELKRRIKEALLVDDRIEEVTNFSFERTGKNGLFVTFAARTVEGVIEVGVNVNV